MQWWSMRMFAHLPILCMTWDVVNCSIKTPERAWKWVRKRCLRAGASVALGELFWRAPCDTDIVCSGDGWATPVLCPAWTDLPWGAKDSDGVIKIKPPNSMVWFNHKSAALILPLGCTLCLEMHFIIGVGVGEELGFEEGVASFLDTVELKVVRLFLKIWYLRSRGVEPWPNKNSSSRWASPETHMALGSRDNCRAVLLFLLSQLNLY